MGIDTQNKDGPEVVKPTSHETQVNKRIHPLARNQPIGPVAGSLGSTASSKMQNTTAMEDPDVIDNINSYYSPARHLQGEATVRAFIQETLEALSELVDTDAADGDELDEFATLAGGAVAGVTGPLSGNTKYSKSKTIKKQS